MANVEFRNATRTYPGSSVPAVDQLTLEITEGEFMVLVGPSGCGKSTALRMLAGLEPVDDGAILIGGEDVAKQELRDRDVAMVFQNYALYPHMTVAENMGFALRLHGMGTDERRAKVVAAARLLDLEPYLDRHPRALSGGQRQRVAMGRAIVREPSVFLMDEPLSNLDAKLRVETRGNIAALQARLGTTTLYVTHDQVEAMTMGHRVAVLKAGVLQQVDTPRTLYDHPVNAFVAGFIGSPGMNLRTAELVPGGALLGEHLLPLKRDVLDAAAAAGLSTVTVGVRPESFLLSTDGTGIKLTTAVVEELGADAYVHGHLPGDDALHSTSVVARFDGRVSPRAGETILVTVRPDEVYTFHPDTGARLTA
ncbi:MAG: sn-glycerol-3-phosphate ABC transporter ATP-binding protein UgpC [Mycobacteriaceae bacterium]